MAPSSPIFIQFAHKDIVETRDINENILVELDQEGALVSMTIEHATLQTDIDCFSYQKVANMTTGEA